MAFPLRTNFEYVFQVGADWYRDVGTFLNELWMERMKTKAQNGTGLVSVWSAAPVVAGGQLTGIAFVEYQIAGPIRTTGKTTTITISRDTNALSGTVSGGLCTVSLPPGGFLTGVDLATS